MTPRTPRRSSDLETNVAPGALPEDMRHPDQPAPRSGDGARETPTDTGAGSGYEREIDRLDAAARAM